MTAVKRPLQLAPDAQAQTGETITFEPRNLYPYELYLTATEVLSKPGILNPMPELANGMDEVLVLVGEEPGLVKSMVHYLNSNRTFECFQEGWQVTITELATERDVPQKLMEYLPFTTLDQYWATSRYELLETLRQSSEAGNRYKLHKTNPELFIDSIGKTPRSFEESWLATKSPQSIYTDVWAKALAESALTTPERAQTLWENFSFAKYGSYKLPRKLTANKAGLDAYLQVGLAQDVFAELVGVDSDTLRNASQLLYELGSVELARIAYTMRLENRGRSIQDRIIPAECYSWALAHCAYLTQDFYEQLQELLKSSGVILAPNELVTRVNKLYGLEPTDAETQV